MAVTLTNPHDPQVLQSVDVAKPDNEGGPIARTGFKYQDKIAVGFLIELLEDSALRRVQCETHDDVVLVREIEGSSNRLAEYVQVKASEEGKHWSIADLCSAKGGAGTSTLEVSLARDKYLEASQFRLVTLRPVNGELAILTLPRGAPGREAPSVRLSKLQSELDKRFPGLTSTKGNGTRYWLANCFWDQCHDEEAVHHRNLVRLLRLAQKEALPLLPEPAELLLEEMSAKAKAAGDAKWDSDRDIKTFERHALRAWWEKRTRELLDGAAVSSGGKLREKMTDASLPNDQIELALDLRRDYAAAARTPRYMEPEEPARLQLRAKGELASLRARLVAGQLALDGPGFHALCLDRMDAINRERAKGSEDHSAFLKGCMYDIADRCLFRFERRTG